MKKIIYIAIVIIASIAFASCQKDSIGGTKVQDLSGQWYVQVDIVDASGDVVLEDFNEGRSILLTYNTASDADNILYVNDQGAFWKFIVQVPCSLNDKTFGSESPVANESYECNVTLTNGKIIPDGATTPSGQKADYIEFLVNFDDDDLSAYDMPGVSYPEYYGGVAYKVSGWRYTGFVNDD